MITADSQHLGGGMLGCQTLEGVFQCLPADLQGNEGRGLQGSQQRVDFLGTANAEFHDDPGSNRVRDVGRMAFEKSNFGGLASAIPCSPRSSGSRPSIKASLRRRTSSRVSSSNACRRACKTLRVEGVQFSLGSINP